MTYAFMMWYCLTHCDKDVKNNKYYICICIVIKSLQNDHTPSNLFSLNVLSNFKKMKDNIDAQ